MSDPRLARGLALTRQLLEGSPAQRLAGIDELGAERAKLAESLCSAPPLDPVSSELALELQFSEAALAQALAELRTELGQRIELLRRARHAASGYRPATPGHPAFVSRSV